MSRQVHLGRQTNARGRKKCRHDREDILCADRYNANKPKQDQGTDADRLERDDKHNVQTDLVQTDQNKRRK
jgi:hypothetical protein